MADVKVEVKVNLSGLEKKLGKENLTKGKLAMANQMLLDMDRYIPMKHGSLRASGYVTPGRAWIRYNTPYARTQFYGIVSHPWGRSGPSVPIKKYTTPGTGKRWDLKAKAKHADSWGKVFLRGAGLNK